MCEGKGEEVSELGSGMPLCCAGPSVGGERMWETLHSDTLLPALTPRIRMHPPKWFVNKVETPFHRGGKAFQCGENGGKRESQ